MIATLYTQPACGGCVFAAKDLDKAGIEHVARNVRADESAAEQVSTLYAALRPGMVPTTPVVVLGDDVFFGAAELHSHLRCLAKAAA